MELIYLFMTKAAVTLAIYFKPVYFSALVYPRTAQLQRKIAMMLGFGNFWFVLFG